MEVKLEPASEPQGQEDLKPTLRRSQRSKKTVNWSGILSPSKKRVKTEPSVIEENNVLNTKELEEETKNVSEIDTTSVLGPESSNDQEILLTLEEQEVLAGLDCSDMAVTINKNPFLITSDFRGIGAGDLASAEVLSESTLSADETADYELQPGPNNSESRAIFLDHSYALNTQKFVGRIDDGVVAENEDPGQNPVVERSSAIHVYRALLDHSYTCVTPLALIEALKLKHDYVCAFDLANVPPDTSFAPILPQMDLKNIMPIVQPATVRVDKTVGKTQKKIKFKAIPKVWGDGPCTCPLCLPTPMGRTRIASRLLLPPSRKSPVAGKEKKKSVTKSTKQDLSSAKGTAVKKVEAKKCKNAIVSPTKQIPVKEEPVEAPSKSRPDKFTEKTSQRKKKRRRNTTGWPTPVKRFTRKKAAKVQTNKRSLKKKTLKVKFTKTPLSQKVPKRKKMTESPSRLLSIEEAVKTRRRSSNSNNPGPSREPLLDKKQNGKSVKKMLKDLPQKLVSRKGIAKTSKSSIESPIASKTRSRRTIKRNGNEGDNSETLSASEGEDGAVDTVGVPGGSLSPKRWPSRRVSKRLASVYKGKPTVKAGRISSSGVASFKGPAAEEIPKINESDRDADAESESGGVKSSQREDVRRRKGRRRGYLTTRLKNQSKMILRQGRKTANFTDDSTKIDESDEDKPDEEQLMDIDLSIVKVEDFQLDDDYFDTRPGPSGQRDPRTDWVSSFYNTRSSGRNVNQSSYNSSTPSGKNRNRVQGAESLQMDKRWTPCNDGENAVTIKVEREAVIDEEYCSQVYDQCESQCENEDPTCVRGHVMLAEDSTFAKGGTGFPYITGCIGVNEDLVKTENFSSERSLAGMSLPPTDMNGGTEILSSINSNINTPSNSFVDDPDLRNLSKCDPKMAKTLSLRPSSVTIPNGESSNLEMGRKHKECTIIKLSPDTSAISFSAPKNDKPAEPQSNKSDSTPIAVECKSRWPCSNNVVAKELDKTGNKISSNRSTAPTEKTKLATNWSSELYDGNRNLKSPPKLAKNGLSTFGDPLKSRVFAGKDQIYYSAMEEQVPELIRRNQVQFCYRMAVSHYNGTEFNSTQPISVGMKPNGRATEHNSTGSLKRLDLAASQRGVSETAGTIPGAQACGLTRQNGNSLGEMLRKPDFDPEHVTINSTFTVANSMTCTTSSRLKAERPNGDSSLNGESNIRRTTADHNNTCTSSSSDSTKKATPYKSKAESSYLEHESNPLIFVCGRTVEFSDDVESQSDSMGRNDGLSKKIFNDKILSKSNEFDAEAVSKIHRRNGVCKAGAIHRVKEDLKPPENERNSTITLPENGQQSSYSESRHVPLAHTIQDIEIIPEEQDDCYSDSSDFGIGGVGISPDVLRNDFQPETREVDVPISSPLPSKPSDQTASPDTSHLDRMISLETLLGEKSPSLGAEDFLVDSLPTLPLPATTAHESPHARTKNQEPTDSDGERKKRRGNLRLLRQRRRSKVWNLYRGFLKKREIRKRRQQEVFSRKTLITKFPAAGLQLSPKRFRPLIPENIKEHPTPELSCSKQYLQDHIETHDAIRKTCLEDPDLFQDLDVKYPRFPVEKYSYHCQIIGSKCEPYPNQLCAMEASNKPAGLDGIQAAFNCKESKKIGKREIDKVSSDRIEPSLPNWKESNNVHYISSESNKKEAENLQVDYDNAEIEKKSQIGSDRDWIDLNNVKIEKNETEKNNIQTLAFATQSLNNNLNFVASQNLSKVLQNAIDYLRKSSNKIENDLVAAKKIAKQMESSLTGHKEELAKLIVATNREKIVDKERKLPVNPVVIKKCGLKPPSSFVDFSSDGENAVVSVPDEVSANGLSCQEKKPLVNVVKTESLLEKRSEPAELRVAKQNGNSSSRDRLREGKTRMLLRVDPSLRPRKVHNGIRRKNSSLKQLRNSESPSIQRAVQSSQPLSCSSDVIAVSDEETCPSPSRADERTRMDKMSDESLGIGEFDRLNSTASGKNFSPSVHSPSAEPGFVVFPYSREDPDALSGSIRLCEKPGTITENRSPYSITTEYHLPRETGSSIPPATGIQSARNTIKDLPIPKSANPERPFARTVANKSGRPRPIIIRRKVPVSEKREALCSHCETDDSRIVLSNSLTNSSDSEHRVLAMMEKCRKKVASRKLNAMHLMQAAKRSRLETMATDRLALPDRQSNIPETPGNSWLSNGYSIQDQHSPCVEKLADATHCFSHSFNQTIGSLISSPANNPMSTVPSGRTPLLRVVDIPETCESSSRTNCDTNHLQETPGSKYTDSETPPGDEPEFAPKLDYTVSDVDWRFVPYQPPPRIVYLNKIIHQRLRREKISCYRHLRNGRPAIPMSIMAAMAIENTRDKFASVHEVADFILQYFPYFRQCIATSRNHWTNELRRNLKSARYFKTIFFGQESYYTFDKSLALPSDRPIAEDENESVDVDVQSNFDSSDLIGQAGITENEVDSGSNPLVPICNYSDGDDDASQPSHWFMPEGIEPAVGHSEHSFLGSVKNHVNTSFVGMETGLATCYKCFYCSADFSQLSDAYEHALSHPQVLKRCPACDFASPDRIQFGMHVNLHKNPQMNC